MPFFHENNQLDIIPTKFEQASKWALGQEKKWAQAKKQAGPIGHPLTLEAGSGVGQIKGTTMLGTCPALIRRKNNRDNEEEGEGRKEIKMNRTDRTVEGQPSLRVSWKMSEN